ncbi:hypothetical protein PybrP1_009223 [[Pythium] brassicae (nom. inval.)]|nr:hypothetical protein PybrP1_009223 [[Pythium] brassicae (nom. inval.)]
MALRTCVPAGGEHDPPGSVCSGGSGRQRGQNERRRTTGMVKLALSTPHTQPDGRLHGECYNGHEGASNTYSRHEGQQMSTTRQAEEAANAGGEAQDFHRLRAQRGLARCGISHDVSPATAWRTVTPGRGIPLPWGGARAASTKCTDAIVDRLVEYVNENCSYSLKRMKDTLHSTLASISLPL